MKHILPSLLLIAATAAADPATNIHFIGQHQQTSNVVWDMPVGLQGASPSALGMESGGALFQLWAVNPSIPRDYLLDQKLVGAYLPQADLQIITLDPHGTVPRTRVDQPFRVEVTVSDLLTGPGLPSSATSVLMERHLANYDSKRTPLDPVVVKSGTPADSGYLSTNGRHVMAFPASGLTAPDPTTACGEEHFVIHAVSDGSLVQSQLASAYVQVWPVASGAIKGIKNGDNLRFQAPKLELILNDLYPRSDTYLMLYPGTQVEGAEGKIVLAFPMDRDIAESHVLPVTDLDSKLDEDGAYTLALFSDTIYGRELLCNPVSFTIRRTMHVNAMQVDLTNSANP